MSLALLADVAPGHRPGGSQGLTLRVSFDDRDHSERVGVVTASDLVAAAPEPLPGGLGSHYLAENDSGQAKVHKALVERHWPAWTPEEVGNPVEFNLAQEPSGEGGRGPVGTRLQVPETTTAPILANRGCRR